MKRIEAIIKPYKLDEVKNRVLQVGAPGMTVWEIRDFLHMGDAAKTSHGRVRKAEPLPKLQVQIVVDDAMVHLIVAAIRASANLGKSEEDRIFISPIADAIRIRTGERGPGAL